MKTYTKMQTDEVKVIENGFRNNNVSVSFYKKREYEKPYIIVRDLTDQWNLPTAYTRKVRGINKAWNNLVELFNDEKLNKSITMNTIISILQDHNLGVHSYCAMD